MESKYGVFLEKSFTESKILHSNGQVTNLALVVNSIRQRKNKERKNPHSLLSLKTE